MPTISVRGDTEFYYTDSGAPQKDDYNTLILIHGHTFHQGVFKKLFPEAQKAGIRIVTPNRRAFEGTSPYTQEELDVLNGGTSEKRREVLDQQGIYLAHFVDAIIQEHKLKKNSIAVGAWSLGASFLLMLISAMELMGNPIQIRLREHLKAFIFWDVPSRMFGYDDPTEAYVPLYDSTIPLEERGPKFLQWSASYFTHTSVTSGNANDLIFKEPDPNVHTFADLPFERFDEVADLASGEKGDTIIGEPSLKDLLAGYRKKALFDPTIREHWGHPAMYHLWGNKNPWNVIYSMWLLKDEYSKVGDQDVLAMKWKEFDGSNHFGMWDMPDVSLDVFINLIEGNECRSNI